jgi:hypothetical protein
LAAREASLNNKLTNMTTLTNSPEFVTPASVNLDSLKKTVRHEHILEQVKRWTRPFLLSAIGFCNNLLYCLAKSQGVINRVGGQLKVFGNAIARLLKPQSVCLPIVATEQFLKDFWEGSLNSRSSIRNVRKALADFGFFQIDPENDRFCGINQKATYLRVNARYLLVFAELLQEVWLERGYGFDSLPEHKGASTKMLYDAVFTRGLGFGRSGNPQAGTMPMTQDEASELRAAQALLTRVNEIDRLASLAQTAAQFERTGLDRRNPGLMERIRSEMRATRKRIIDRWRRREFEDDLPY